MGQEHVHHIAWQLGNILFYCLHTHRLLTRWYYGTRSFAVVTPPWWSYTQPKASMASSMMAEDSCKQQPHHMCLIPMSLCGQGMRQDATSKYCLVCVNTGLNACPLYLCPEAIPMLLWSCVGMSSPMLADFRSLHQADIGSSFPPSTPSSDQLRMAG